MFLRNIRSPSLKITLLLLVAAVVRIGGTAAGGSQPWCQDPGRVPDTSEESYDHPEDPDDGTCQQRSRCDCSQSLSRKQADP
jgi:hypothetical protein